MDGHWIMTEDDGSGYTQPSSTVMHFAVDAIDIYFTEHA